MDAENLGRITRRQIVYFCLNDPSAIHQYQFFTIYCRPLASYQQMLVTELAFSQLHLASKLLVARPAEGVRVHFSYPKPAHFGVYEQNWPFPMEFDQEHTQIFIPDQWLRQRVRTGDPTTNVLFSQQCEELVNGMA